MKHRLAVMASGNGSNAEAIIRYFEGNPRVDVPLVLTNNPQAFVIERAKNLNREVIVFDRAMFRDKSEFLNILKDRNITHIALAGFLWLIPAFLIEAFPNRIINIHPALLPQFGGKGMYGAKVHETVRASGAKETGITIHLVNEHYDDGAIVFQQTCEIDESCDATEIAKRVHALEHAHYPVVIEEWIVGEGA